MTFRDKVVKGLRRKKKHYKKDKAISQSIDEAIKFLETYRPNVDREIVKTVLVKFGVDTILGGLNGELPD